MKSEQEDTYSLQLKNPLRTYQQEKHYYSHQNHGSLIVFHPPQLRERRNLSALLKSKLLHCLLFHQMFYCLLLKLLTKQVILPSRYVLNSTGYHLRENDCSFDALQTYCFRIIIKLL